MTADWKHHGLRIVRAGQLDSNTPQTPGMTRAEAISHAKVGAQKHWAGTVKGTLEVAHKIGHSFRERKHQWRERDTPGNFSERLSHGWRLAKMSVSWRENSG